MWNSHVKGGYEYLLWGFEYNAFAGKPSFVLLNFRGHHEKLGSIKLLFFV